MVSFDEIKYVCDPVLSEQISLLFCFGDCCTELHLYMPTIHTNVSYLPNM